MSSTVKTYPAYFTSRRAGVFEPTPSVAGYWGGGLLSGPAVAGLAARALQRRYGTPELQPARPTIDLFKPARQVPAARIDFAEATTVGAPGSELFT